MSEQIKTIFIGIFIAGIVIAAAYYFTHDFNYGYFLTSKASGH